MVSTRTAGARLDTCRWSPAPQPDKEVASEKVVNKKRLTDRLTTKPRLRSGNLTHSRRGSRIGFTHNGACRESSSLAGNPFTAGDTAFQRQQPGRAMPASEVSPG